MSKKFAPSQVARETTVVALLAFFAGAIVAGAVGASIILTQTTSAAAYKPLRQSDLNPESSFEFTDPLIGLSAADAGTSPQYQDLANKVSSYIADQKSKGLTSASVTFRDIRGQARFDINPSEIYTPASLYKVPLMMAYYRLAQEDPSILSETLVYTGGQDLDAGENVRSPVQLAAGQSYSVESLIEHMIRYSDNNADQLLLQHLIAINKESVLTQIFSDLNVNFGSLTANTDLITPQSYLLFMRVLYNATYLDREYSEKALALLTTTDFAEGIAADIPNNIQIAHKFGDANIASNGNVAGYELHDCGIVYLPDHPYMLCVMTKGKDIVALKSVIATISQYIYQDLETRYPSQK